MQSLRTIACATVVSLACLDIANAQSTRTAPPPAATSNTADTPPAPGANSFTEAQAKDRLEKAGFTQIADLKKDDGGIWRATGMQSDKKVTLALDFRGNVVATQ